MTVKNNKSNLSSLLCSRIYAGLHWPPPVFTLFIYLFYWQTSNNRWQHEKKKTITSNWNISTVKIKK